VIALVIPGGKRTATSTLWAGVPILRPGEIARAHRHSAVAMEYINPHTGGPVLPTMACWLQLIRSGMPTKAHRQTNSAVYHVSRGRDILP
jgi:gentisate 1,2-dioxygenase